MRAYAIWASSKGIGIKMGQWQTEFGKLTAWTMKYKGNKK